MASKVKPVEWVMYSMLLTVVAIGVLIKYLESNSLISTAHPVIWTYLTLSAFVIIMGIFVKKFDK